MLGTPVSMPVLVAPMAFQQIAHEEGAPLAAVVSGGNADPKVAAGILASP